MEKLATTSLMLVSLTILLAFGSNNAIAKDGTVAAGLEPKPAATSVTANVSLTKEQCSHFQASLLSLAAQAHVAIIAEGAPLHPHLTAAATPNLTAPVPISQALVALGAAYDYDVQRQGGGVFLLTKRYSDPRDLPCVTLDECQASLKDVLLILDAFNPHFQESTDAAGPDTQRDTVVSFFKSLSPAQMVAAHSNSLRYGDLLPDQQTMIENFILYQYVQIPLDQTQDQLNLLLEASHSILAGRNESKYAGAYMEVPNTVGTGKHLTSVDGAITAINQPPPDWLLLSSTLSAEAVKTSTLAEAVASLQPIHGQQPVIDTPIGAKPVTFAGLANAAPMKILEALSKLYGLRISSSDKSAPMLAREAPLTPDKLNGIAAYVWQALPLPYTRALNIDAHLRAPQGKGNTAWMPTNDYTLYSQEQGHIREAMEEMQHEAIRRLRLAMQPQMRKRGPDAHIPVSLLSEDARSALAVVLMSEIALKLREAFTGLPSEKAFACLDNINNMIISTVPNETAYRRGVAIPSLYLQGSPSGSTEKIIMGGIRYISD